MKTKIIFAGLLGLAVMLPLALPAMALASPQDDYKKGVVAFRVQDYPEALRWWRKAAEQGNVDAQLALGDMYKVGHGVAQNRVQEHKWFNIASAFGNQDAKWDRWRVEQKMNAQQITEAKRAANKWLEAYEKRRK